MNKKACLMNGIGHLPEIQSASMLVEAHRIWSSWQDSSKRSAKSQEQNRDLYTTFVDLTKVFDTVSTEGLWKIVVRHGCPEHFITTLSQFHDSMTAQGRDDGVTLEAFPVTNGVKHGCVLSPTLFIIMFSAVLTQPFCMGQLGRSNYQV